MTRRLMTFAMLVLLSATFVEAARPSSPGLRLGSSASATATVVLDSAVSVARDTDDAPRDRRLRVGEHLDLPVIAATKWERLTDGDQTSWRLALSAPGATFLRPHFRLPPGAPLALYNEPDPLRTRPVAARATGDFWGPVVAGEVLQLEWLAADPPPTGLLDRVSVGYRPLAAGAKESWCYLDPTCYPRLDAARTAIGQMEFESGGGTYICSGALVTDKAESMRPWFMTANHCISGSGEAATVFVTWRYFTDECDGDVPDWNSLPSSSGADLKFTNDQIDVTLIELDEDPPAGTSFLGWTTAAQSPGDAITVLHHPDGSYMRVSFGDIDADLGSYWSVQYTESSTEGGSSGSPLLNDDLQVIGTLSSGDAACANMSGTDEFGKFSAAWNAGLSAFLGDGADDDDDDADDDDDDDYAPPPSDDDDDDSDGGEPSDRGSSSDGGGCGC